MSSADDPKTTESGGQPGDSHRTALITKLNGLSPADLASLVTAIPGAATHISRHVTVPEQVAELFRWAESTTGPKLAIIEEKAKELQRSADRAALWGVLESMP